MKEEGIENGHGTAEWIDTRGSVITPIITPWVSLDQLDSVAEGVFDEAIRQDEARAFLKDPSHIMMLAIEYELVVGMACLLYTSPSPRDGLLSRMPSSA